MAQHVNYTPNLALKKPEDRSFADQYVFNDNMDILDAEVAKKVNKIEGKGLSQNDFTDEYKNKVDRGLLQLKTVSPGMFRGASGGLGLFHKAIEPLKEQLPSSIIFDYGGVNQWRPLLAFMIDDPIIGEVGLTTSFITEKIEEEFIIPELKVKISVNGEEVIISPPFQGLLRSRTEDEETVYFAEFYETSNLEGVRQGDLITVEACAESNLDGIKVRVKFDDCGLAFYYDDLQSFWELD